MTWVKARLADLAHIDLPSNLRRHDDEDYMTIMTTSARQAAAAFRRRSMPIAEQPTCIHYACPNDRYYSSARRRQGSSSKICQDLVRVTEFICTAWIQQLNIVYRPTAVYGAQSTVGGQDIFARKYVYKTRPSMTE